MKLIELWAPDDGAPAAQGDQVAEATQPVETVTEQPVQPADPEKPAEPELPSWMHQLKKDRQGNDFLRQFRTIDEMAQYALNKTLAKTVPEENATEQEKLEFYKAIGVPEKPEEYGLTLDSETLVPEMKEFFEKTFHSAQLTKQQAVAVAKAYEDFVKEETEKIRLERNESYGNLMKELRGKYGPQYPEKAENYSKALKQFGSESFKAKMKELGVDNDPVVTEFIMKIGETLAEHKVLGVHSSQGASLPEGQVLTYGEQFQKVIAAKG